MWQQVVDELDAECRQRGIPMLGPEKARFVAGRVAEKRPERVVECGTAIGYSGLWIADTLRPASKPKPFRPPPPTWTLALMVVGIIAFWIGRNLPWFSFLAAGTPLLTG